MQATVLLDPALRGAAVVVLLLLALLLLRDHARQLAARLGAALAVGVAAYALSSAPALAAFDGAIVLAALASGNAVVFWLFARALFEDGFALRPWHGAIWLGFVLAVPVCLLSAPALPLIAVGLALGRVVFAVLAVAQTLAGWRADLVESRRRLRPFIVGAIALHIVVDAAGLTAIPLINATALAVMTVVIAWPLLRVAGDELFAVVAPAEPEPVRLGGDPALVAALERLMTVERIHRREGLTIGALATRLDLPEYRLRRLINQGLGYRNFNAFLNRYRIAEAKQALADPAQAEVPILTIALDAGFQSLGPFNRAFKAEIGLTPSEYRRQQAKALPQNEVFKISKSA